MRLTVPLVFVLVAMALNPSKVDAQVAAASTDSAMSPEIMERFAKAHLAVSAVRDRYQAALAEPKSKKLEVQQALRDSLRLEVQRTLQQNAMREDEFNRLTRRISVDTALRKAFEAELARRGGRKETTPPAAERAPPAA